MKRQKPCPISTDILHRLKKIRLRHLPRRQEEEFKLCVVISLHTGLHPFDVLDLRWKALTLDQNGLVCKHGYLESAVKVPLDEETAQRLTRLRNREAAGGRVFRHLTDVDVNSFLVLVG